MPRTTLRALRSLFALFGMDRIRRDVVCNELSQGRIRMALCVLFLPAGYSLSLDERRRPRLK